MEFGRPDLLICNTHQFHIDDQDLVHGSVSERRSEDKGQKGVLVRNGLCACRKQCGGQRRTCKGRFSLQSQKPGYFYSSSFSFLLFIVLLINKQFGVNPLATKENAILKL